MGSTDTLTLGIRFGWPRPGKRTIRPRQMQPTWAAQLGRREADAAECLRTLPGIEACEAGEHLWLRGDTLDDDLDLKLRKLPGAVRYTVRPDGQLVARGDRVPKGRLPDGEWKLLADWIELTPQPAALGGEFSERVPLRLVRGDVEEAPNILVTDMATWRNYAAGAPELRLRPLTFAAAADGRVLVRGQPLPPLPGVRYVEHDRVAVPCGLTFCPALEPAVLHELLGLAPAELALFDAVGGFERLHCDQFVRATRSAVRFTVESSHD